MGKFKLVITLLCLMCLASGAAEEQDDSVVANDLADVSKETKECCHFPDRMIAEGYAAIAFGKTIGVDESYASAGLWFGNWCDETLYFVDVRWHHLCNNSNAANGGLGIRFGDDCRGCGANIYYDWRKFHKKDFKQVSVGIDGWIAPWEFRLNTSIPIESFSTLERTTIDYLDGYQFSSVETAYTCKLVSLLLGREFDLREYCSTPLTFTLLAGSYWISDQVQENCYGGIASIDLKMYDMFSLRAIYTHDPIFNNRVQALLTINIPFNTFEEKLCSCFSSFFTRRPERLELIPIHTRTHCSYNWSSP